MVKPRPADSAATAWTATDEKGSFHFSYLSILIQSYAKFALHCKLILTLVDVNTFETVALKSVMFNLINTQLSVHFSGGFEQIGAV